MSIHAQALLAAYQQGVNLRVTRVLYDMYCRLKVCIKIGNRVTSVVVPVKKGVRQGSLLSPSLYNNSVLSAQASVNVSCIAKSINVSLLTLTYAYYLRGRPTKSKSVN